MLFSVQVMKVSSDKDGSSPLCMKALANRGRLDTVSQQMASHPQYLESFLRTQHYILNMDGPLPHHYRHYIAIMVSVPLDDCTCFIFKGGNGSLRRSIRQGK